ncbi:30S ribosomal protein S15 [Streptococcus pyogenes]|nr:30S ribosomal protein S15 [Streptococcus pyogenes]
MAKEPWEEKIVDDTIGTRTRKSRNAFISTPWLTALLSVFFVIIVAILFIFFYTSNSGSNRQAETNGFYGASTHKKTRKASNAKKTSSSSTTTDTTPSSEETLASSEGTGKPLLYWQVRGQLLLQPVQVFLWSSYKHLIQST